MRKAKSEPNDYLGSTESLIKTGEDGSLPLFVQFQYHPSDSPEQVATDEAEVIFAYSDGFAVPSHINSLPESWRMTPPDPEGNALFLVPSEACIHSQHRKFRRKRYHGNIKCRQFDQTNKAA